MIQNFHPLFTINIQKFVLNVPINEVHHIGELVNLEFLEQASFQLSFEILKTNFHSHYGINETYTTTEICFKPMQPYEN